MVVVTVCATEELYSTVLEAFNVPNVGILASCRLSVLVPDEAAATDTVPVIGLPLATVSVTPSTEGLPTTIVELVPLTVHAEVVVALLLTSNVA